MLRFVGSVGKVLQTEMLINTAFWSHKIQSFKQNLKTCIEMSGVAVASDSLLAWRTRQRRNIITRELEMRTNCSCDVSHEGGRHKVALILAPGAGSCTGCSRLIRSPHTLENVPDLQSNTLDFTHPASAAFCFGVLQDESGAVAHFQVLI